MRLWSIHPMYLDCKGLLAVWREGLLARSVLQGMTKGYQNHPQLDRFRKTANPIDAIDAFLSHVWAESQRRCYNFDLSKIQFDPACGILNVTKGQLEYEFDHLMRKLEKRDKVKHDVLSKVNKKTILQNPVFLILPGKIEDWEKVSDQLKAK